MHEPATALATWESFYVIVGSSAAALTGLQFVVMALIAETRRRSTWNEIDAFGTPTIVHFSGVLLLSAILSAPWPSLAAVGRAYGVCGAAGLIYVGIVIRRARSQTAYTMVTEDWIWHIILPFVAYATLFVDAFPLLGHETISLFLVAAAALLLLFIGIHNAWDTVIYIAIEHLKARDE